MIGGGGGAPALGWDVVHCGNDGVEDYSVDRLSDDGNLSEGGEWGGGGLNKGMQGSAQQCARAQTLDASTPAAVNMWKMLHSSQLHAPEASK